jgi:hypothetical protein
MKRRRKPPIHTLSNPRRLQGRQKKLTKLASRVHAVGVAGTAAVAAGAWAFQLKLRQNPPP